MVSARMKWVNHPRWGWLPDEAPLFEALFRRDAPELRVAVEVEERHFIRMADAEGRSMGFLCCNTIDSSAPYVPLTTAARELQAALRAEVTR